MVMSVKRVALLTRLPVSKAGLTWMYVLSAGALVLEVRTKT